MKIGTPSLIARNVVYLSGPGPTEAFFSRLQNRGGQNLAGCGNFSTACSFYCTACSFYCTADARSDSENLQKFLKNWLFLTYFVPIILKPI